MKREVTIAVSGFLVSTMIVHASEGLFKGVPLSQVHLITSANLVPGSSIAGVSLDYVQNDTINEEIHAASAPDESGLRLGGLMHPNT